MKFIYLLCGAHCIVRKLQNVLFHWDKSDASCCQQVAAWANLLAKSWKNLIAGGDEENEGNFETKKVKIKKNLELEKSGFQVKKNIGCCQP
jgi:hypothetical protein